MTPASPEARPRPGALLAAAGAWHLSVWVLLPLLVYRMLPLDALELLGWGQEWQWGYLQRLAQPRLRTWH